MFGWIVHHCNAYEACEAVGGCDHRVMDSCQAPNSGVLQYFSKWVHCILKQSCRGRVDGGLRGYDAVVCRCDGGVMESRLAGSDMN